MQLFNLVYIFLFGSFFILFRKWKSNSQTKRLPPGPWKVPILGNILHMLGGLPHHVLRDLAKKYGPLMHLQLGELSLVVVSNPEMAKQVLKTHDLAFASRPKLLAVDMIAYNGSDIAFSPYGDYWRQMRKICVLELFSAKMVRSFNSIRRDEISCLLEFFLSSNSGKPVNVTKRIYSFTSCVVFRSITGKAMEEQHEFFGLIEKISSLIAGFDVADLFPSLNFLHAVSGMKAKIMDARDKVDSILENVINEHKNNFASGKSEYLVDVLLRLEKEGGLQFPITNDDIKAILIDLFGGGTETSSTTMDWAMVEMMRNPIILEKAQTEVRETFRRKESFDEDDVDELKYLKLVVKETLRLHPPAPLLLPRECREKTSINSYIIPLKTKVIVNAWAIGRDPKYWDNAESFKPERFEKCSLDFAGKNFEYLPFGSGRRMCPGISFGLANVYLPLAQLLYHFDWKLPDGISPSDMDMTESFGTSATRKSHLYLIPTPYRPSQV